MGNFQIIMMLLLLSIERNFAWFLYRTSPAQKKTALRSTISNQVPLSQSLEELSSLLDGKGRAQLCWQFLKMGIDPVWYFSEPSNSTKENVGVLGDDKGWTRRQVQDFMTSSKVGDSLGKKATKLLEDQFGSIERDISSLTKITTSDDGTTKLLLRLVADDLEVESVIIPWEERGKSTLCISSQVGCRQVSLLVYWV